MITVEYKNIFNWSGDAICIPINMVVKRNGRLVMGAGLAKQALNRYPIISEVFGSQIDEKNFNLPVYIAREYRVIGFITKPGWVYNYSPSQLMDKYAKASYGYPTPGWMFKSSLKLIEKSAHKLVEYADKVNLEEVALPPVGCGYGGLEFGTVKNLLSQLLDDRFYLIEPKKKEDQLNVDPHKMRRVGTAHMFWRHPDRDEVVQEYFPIYEGPEKGTLMVMPWEKDPQIFYYDPEYRCWIGNEGTYLQEQNGLFVEIE